jgi:hypothetical protein
MVATLKTTNIQEPSSSTVNLTLGSTGGVTFGAAATTNTITSAAATALTIQSAGTTAITVDTSQNATFAGTVNMSSSFLRNRIINGNMAVDQRNAGAAQTLTSGGLYSVDRWQTYVYTANLTGQQVAGSSGFQYAYRITGASGNTQAQLQQKIEAANCYDLAGQTVTLSAYMANTSNTTMNWVVYYANSTDNFSANTIVTSGTWTLTSSLARYTATISLPSAANTGLLIIFYNSGQTSGTWTTTGVQLEQGSVATPFERPLYSKQLADCQRYYEVIYYASTGYGNNSNAVAFGIPLKVTKRTSPTVTIGTDPAGEIINFPTPTASVQDSNSVWIVTAGTATAGMSRFGSNLAISAEL